MMLRKIISLLLCFSVAFGDTAVVYPQVSSSMPSSTYDETLQVLEDMWQRSNDYYNQLLEDMWERSIQVDPSDVSTLGDTLNKMRMDIDELRSIYQQADPDLRSALYRVYPDLLYDIRTITTTTAKIHSSAYNPVPLPYGYARTVAVTDGFNALLRRLVSSLPSLAASVPFFLFNTILEFGYVNLGEDQLDLYRLYIVRKAYQPSVSPEQRFYFLPFLRDVLLPDLLPDPGYLPYGFPWTSGCYVYYPSGAVEPRLDGKPVYCSDHFTSDYTPEFMQQVYEIAESLPGCNPRSNPYSVAGAGVARYYEYLTEYILTCSRYYACKQYYLNEEGYEEALRRFNELVRYWHETIDDFKEWVIYQSVARLGFFDAIEHLGEFREYHGMCLTFGRKHEFFDNYTQVCRDYPEKCVFSGSDHKITHFYVSLLFYNPPYTSYVLYEPVIATGTGCDRYLYALCSFGSNILIVSPHEYAYRLCYSYIPPPEWVDVPIPVDCDIDWSVTPDIPPEIEPYISPLLDPDFLPGANTYRYMREAYRKLLRRLSSMRKRLREHQSEVIHVTPPGSFSDVPLVSPFPSFSPSDISYSDGQHTIVLDLTPLEPYILGRLREEVQQSRDIIVSLSSPSRCEEIEERFSVSLRGLIDFFRYSFIAFAVLFGVLSGALGGFSIYLFIRSLSLWRL